MCRVQFSMYSKTASRPNHYVYAQQVYIISASVCVHACSCVRAVGCCICLAVVACTHTHVHSAFRSFAISQIM